MKNRLVNRKVINSIGIGILAFITAGTPVMAAAEGELPEAPKDSESEEAPEETPETETPNAEVSNASAEAQDAVAEAQDTVADQDL